MTKIVTALTSKIKEYSLSPEFIEEFGFVSARIVNGYLILPHKSGKDIRCEFNDKNLPKFKKKLEIAIAVNENGIEFGSNFDSRKLTMKSIGILVKDAEEEQQQQQPKPETDPLFIKEFE